MKLDMKNNKAIGGTWEDLRKEIFTPKEIAESDERVKILSKCDGLGESDVFESETDYLLRTRRLKETLDEAIKVTIDDCEEFSWDD